MSHTVHTEKQYLKMSEAKSKGQKQSEKLFVFPAEPDIYAQILS